MEGKLGRAIMRLMPSAAEVLRVELQASPHVHPKHVRAHVAKLVLQLDLPNMVKEILIRNIKIVQVCVDGMGSALRAPLGKLPSTPGDALRRCFRPRHAGLDILDRASAIHCFNRASVT